MAYKYNTHVRMAASGQDTVNQRWATLLAVQDLLANFSRDARACELQNIIKIRTKLGKGEYSTVYAGGFAGTPLQVAVKHMALDNDRGATARRAIRQVLREDIAYMYLNALVLLKIAPGFPLLFESYLSTENHAHDSLLVMELAHGNLGDFFAEPQAPCHLLSCAAQVLFACLAMGLHLDLVNNDLYPKNILVTRISPRMALRYRVGTALFYVDTGGFLFKLADFGISSSPHIINYTHTQATHYFPERLQCPSFPDFDYGKHILEYDGVPAQARDALVFLRSLAGSRAAAATPVRGWCMYALRLLEESRVHTWVKFQTYLLRIFSPDFLAQCRLQKDMFKVNAMPAHADIEYFDVNGAPDTSENIAWMVKDKLAQRKRHGSNKT